MRFVLLVSILLSTASCVTYHSFEAYNIPPVLQPVVENRIGAIDGMCPDPIALHANVRAIEQPGRKRSNTSVGCVQER